MERNEFDTLVLAALLHDVGKFAERAGAIKSADPDAVRQDYGYGHAHGTSEVIEDLFGSVVHKRISNQHSASETLCNLASRHHKPRTMLEKIIQKADWIASGHERRSSDSEATEYLTSGRERKTQVPLTSILGRVNPDCTDEQRPDRYYRLGTPPVGREDFQSFFPCSATVYPADQVQQDYPKLWAEFSQAIATMRKTADPALMPDADTLLEVCRQYQWCIPASTRREELADVSLFEHSKGTAAIASCLYVWHQETQRFTEPALGDDAAKRFLLFCGDVAGIQKFIYQISSKGAYKLLKGRSFLVQMLCESLSRHLVKKLSLSTANILYASGGKFYLLLPNTDATVALLDAELARYNHDLLMQYRGDLYLRHGWEELSTADLTRQQGHTLSQVWDDLAKKLTLHDRKRYADLSIEDQLNLFGIGEYSGEGSCPVCHSTSKDKDAICKPCQDLKELGRKIGNAVYVLVGEKGCRKDSEAIKLPLGYRLWVLDAEPEPLDGNVLTLWSVNSHDYLLHDRQRKDNIHYPLAPLLIGSNQAFDKEFDEIAGLSQGIKRLGLLRMDVDDLGKVFSKGLQHYQHAGSAAKEPGRFHSLARVTTLSWQLGYFFSGIMPAMIEAEASAVGRVGVVYAGGDDLFIVGAWDALPELALTIKKRFSEFCCDNPAFSLSGGVIMTDGKFPIYKGAEMAGEAETRAKQLKSTLFLSGKKENRKKSALTFLDTPMHWVEFSQVKEQKDRLQTLLVDRVHWPLLQRLRDIASSWSESRRELNNREDLDLSQVPHMLAGEKWRWQMVYALARYGERKNIDKVVLSDLQKFILNNAGTTRAGIELLGVLVRWCELLHRNNKQRSREE